MRKVVGRAKGVWVRMELYVVEEAGSECGIEVMDVVAVMGLGCMGICEVPDALSACSRAKDDLLGLRSRLS